MTFTAIPSIKGQITLPSELREKYAINKETPLIIEDKGNGVIAIKVMRMVDYNAIEYREDKESIGLHFKNGIDPKAIIDAIKEIDG